MPSTPVPLNPGHGIDISWMQFHREDARNRVASSPPGNNSTSTTQHSHTSPNLTINTNGSSTKPLPQGLYPPPQATSPPHTTASPSLANGTGTSTTSALQPSPPASRRGWLSNISSKFSSHAHGNANNESQNPTSPTEKQQPGFLIATLRKFSTPNASGRGAFGRNASNGGVCNRVIMNKNLTRDKCRIVELDGVKLKKVAFCVDVEVSGPPPLPLKDDEAPRRKKKDKEEKEEKVKPAEAEKPKEDAVANGEAAGLEKAEVKEAKETIIEGSSGQEKEIIIQGNEEKEKGEPTTSEPKTQDGTSSAGPQDDQPTITITKDATIPGATPVKAEAVGRRRPTTDVSRIYKRCCQLRETSMLQRMVEQLALANGKTSLVSLDLSGHPLHFSDAVVLSDFLALVPITRLDLENCNISDESLRVILSGLLSVKRPIPKYHHKPSPSPTGSLSSTSRSTHSTSSTNSTENRGRGVIEWLSLRNNPKIGREGWRYISKFLHMSHSLKALDVSMITLPRAPAVHSPTRTRAQTGSSDSTGLFCKALRERLAGVGLDELAMNRCGLNTEQIRCMVDAVHASGTRRFDLMENNINDDGLIYLAKWIKDGKNCEGLNLSNNDLQQHIDILAASLNENSNLMALSLTNCNLNAASLSSLLPALTVLKNFRLLDLSHNPLLFSTQPDALPLLRRYLPRMVILKKLQLADTSMTPDHAIALSEILPEIKTLAHFNIMANPLLVPGSVIGLPPPSPQLAEELLASITDAVMVDSEGGVAPLPSPTQALLADNNNSINREGSQEEGAAMYTAFVAAVKVSKTIVRLDVDDPGAEAGEVIKALARKVVAFCLRNMDAGTDTEYGSTNVESGSKSGDADGEEDEEDEYGDEVAKKDDYVVGGTGVVKALGVCLGNKAHCARGPTSGIPLPMDSSVILGAGDETGERANEMSKALLLRARKIKERIQPALQRAARGEVEEIHHRKLLFLDDTLYRVISRFEEEYPECRLSPPTPHHPHRNQQQPQPSLSCLSQTSVASIPTINPNISTHPYLPTDIDDPEEENENQIKTSLSRRASDVSLASKRLEDEEAQMHRLGTYIQKEIFRSSTLAADGDAHEKQLLPQSEDSDQAPLSARSHETLPLPPSSTAPHTLAEVPRTPPSPSEETFSTPPTTPPQQPLKIHERKKTHIDTLDGDELRQHVITCGGADQLISRFEREGQEERRREVGEVGQVGTGVGTGTAAAEAVGGPKQ